MISNIDQIHHKAVVSTGTTITGAVISHFGGVSQAIQDVAGVVAIISGCAAIVYYILASLEKLRRK